jgi:hypothetical protein
MHIIHKISILMNYLAQKISSHFHLLKMMKFNVKYKLEIMFFHAGNDMGQQDTHVDISYINFQPSHMD